MIDKNYETTCVTPMTEAMSLMLRATIARRYGKKSEIEV